jgi:putative chitinase
MRLTAEELARCTGARLSVATTFLPHIGAAMLAYDINTSERQAAFLSQVGHESGGLRWLVELWGPTPAQVRYEGRKDLGNTQPGDGYRFRGRGLLQTTGRHNYERTGNALGLDLLTYPDLLATPANAARSAAWFWKEHELNELADVGAFQQITRRINGGFNGLEERLALWSDAKEVLA